MKKTFLVVLKLIVKSEYRFWLIAATGGTLMLTPAFAQGENMSGGGNYTEGNMTGSDMAVSGMTTPPTMTP